MKETSNTDHLAVAWQYPGQALEVIPARYSRMTRPNTWPAACLEDSECDDGLWCNGTFSLRDCCLSLIGIAASMQGNSTNTLVMNKSLHIFQAMRRAAMRACANSALIGRAPMDYCAQMTCATN